MTRDMTMLSRVSRTGFLCLALGLIGVPSTAWAWWNNDWSYRKQVTLDGTAQGAALKGDVEGIPVLIRLHDGVFRFTDANPDGSDLRFVMSDDKTPLKYSIEKYDAVFNLAFVWVAIPRVTAKDPVKLWMYYGNPKAASESDPRGVYDSAQVLEYHFSNHAAPGADATGFSNNAATVPKLDESGLIGAAAILTGTDTLAPPAAAALTTTAGMARTVMFWLKPSGAQAAAILSEGDATAAVTLGLDQGIPSVSLSSGGKTQTARAPTPLTGNWQHLALVSSAAATTLFIDGQAGPSIPAGLPALNGPPIFGAAPASGPQAPGYAGLIDELSVANVERSPEYIRLSAMNQGPTDHLVRFGNDEALSTWQSGYFAIILKSVTLDGWVVIGILGLMSVISITVMVSKIRQVGQVARANVAFLELFRRFRADFVALANLIAADAPSRDAAIEKVRKRARRAPLYHIFAAGVEELRDRLREDAAGGHSGALSAESIEAIRASLDASIVEENESLNNKMVMLTIAISGGPFLGLLGTVVGVMITFASIAASGDVNINAIAPGTAAALVATVAGLGVAIPCLFGYNYLNTRVKEITADMRVFVDEFVTRIAETYS
jgi:biopolymer transport protein ExbB